MGAGLRQKHNDDTLIIVVADHAHGISISGTYKEENGKTGREAFASTAMPSGRPSLMKPRRVSR